MKTIIKIKTKKAPKSKQIDMLKVAIMKPKSTCKKK